MNFKTHKNLLRVYYFLHKKNKNNKLSILTKIYIRVYNIVLARLYNAYIPIDCELGNNIDFPHQFYGIFISSRAKIGSNCTIYHHVTIGSNIDRTSKTRVAPVIGNNVLIGVNSNIIGNTIIGDDCIIGAGTTISNAKIPSKTTVVSQKYRLLKNKNY